MLLAGRIAEVEVAGLCIVGRIANSPLQLSTVLTDAVVACEDISIDSALDNTGTRLTN